MVVYTFDLGDGPAVIESNLQLEAGEWYNIEAERTHTEGSLVINGGIAVKGMTSIYTTYVCMTSYIALMLVRHCVTCIRLYSNIPYQFDPLNASDNS